MAGFFPLKMASMRESDTGLWLHNKLGATDELWAPPSIASLLTAAVIDNIRLCFHGLSSAVKLKLLLGTLHLPRRTVDEVRRAAVRTRGRPPPRGRASPGPETPALADPPPPLPSPPLPPPAPRTLAVRGPVPPPHRPPAVDASPSCPPAPVGAAGEVPGRGEGGRAVGGPPRAQRPPRFSCFHLSGYPPGSVTLRSGFLPHARVLASFSSVGLSDFFSACFP